MCIRDRADEAHRGQYGLNEKVVVKQKDNGEVEAKTVIGTARILSLIHILWTVEYLF